MRQVIEDRPDVSTSQDKDLRAHFVVRAIGQDCMLLNANAHHIGWALTRGWLAGEIHAEAGAGIGIQ